MGGCVLRSITRPTRSRSLKFSLAPHYNPSMDWHLRDGRRTTYNTPGHAHELTISCYRRFPFLKSERTCNWLADAIAEARVKHDFALWAYVIMPDHVHLIILPRRADHDIGKISAA